jgi:hypothetical protein
MHQYPLPLFNRSVVVSYNITDALNGLVTVQGDPPILALICMRTLPATEPKARGVIVERIRAMKRTIKVIELCKV